MVIFRFRIIYVENMRVFYSHSKPPILLAHPYLRRFSRCRRRRRRSGTQLSSSSFSSFFLPRRLLSRFIFLIFLIFHRCTISNNHSHNFCKQWQLHSTQAIASNIEILWQVCLQWWRCVEAMWNGVI